MKSIFLMLAVALFATPLAWADQNGQKYPVTNYLEEAESNWNNLTTFPWLSSYSEVDVGWYFNDTASVIRDNKVCKYGVKRDSYSLVLKAKDQFLRSNKVSYKKETFAIFITESKSEAKDIKRHELRKLVRDKHYMADKSGYITIFNLPGDGTQRRFFIVDPVKFSLPMVLSDLPVVTTQASILCKKEGDGVSVRMSRFDQDGGRYTSFYANESQLKNKASKAVDSNSVDVLSYKMRRSIQQSRQTRDYALKTFGAKFKPFANGVKASKEKNPMGLAQTFINYKPVYLLDPYSPSQYGEYQRLGSYGAYKQLGAKGRDGFVVRRGITVTFCDDSYGCREYPFSGQMTFDNGDIDHIEVEVTHDGSGDTVINMEFFGENGSIYFVDDLVMEISHPYQPNPSKPGGSDGSNPFEPSGPPSVGNPGVCCGGSQGPVTTTDDQGPTENPRVFTKGDGAGLYVEL